MIADVVWLSRMAWDSVPDDGYLLGVPDLVVEVWSPANRKGKMEERRDLCLRNGAREFWVAYIDTRKVEVSTPDGGTIAYESGQHVPLFFAPRESIAVDAIFAE